MKDSKIEWTDHTFNPWIGCTKVSPGCKFCYAETMMDKRFGKAQWGPQGRRIRTSKAYWRKPLQWNKQAAAAGIRPRVFCASLADVFEDKDDQADELSAWRKDLFDLISNTPNLDWLLLTKRPENVKSMLVSAGRGFQPLPPWVWIGTSVEDQQRADERIPHLLAIPAAVRFLSVEPLLGPVDLSPWFGLAEGYEWQDCLCDEIDPSDQPCLTCEGRLVLGQGSGIHWVIVGGESGPNARPMHPAWARSLRDQCQEAGVPFHFKQWGEYCTTSYDMATGQPVFRYFQNKRQWIAKAHWINGGICVDATGAVLNNGADFAAAHYPVAILHRVGKKRAGRLLDGREWNEFPNDDGGAR